MRANRQSLSMVFSIASKAGPLRESMAIAIAPAPQGDAECCSATAGHCGIPSFQRRHGAGSIIITCMEVADRWVRRLFARMQSEADQPIVHKLRGRNSNRRLGPTLPASSWRKGTEPK